MDEYLEHLEITRDITPRLRHYMRPPPKLRIPCFYHMPKIHKEGLRPIVSGCSGPLDHLGEYISDLLSPIAKIQPTYLSGTLQLIRDLDALPPLPLGALLVKADVTAMYTSIPQDQAIDTALFYMEKHKGLLPTSTPRRGIMWTLFRFFTQMQLFPVRRQTLPSSGRIGNGKSSILCGSKPVYV